MDIGLLYAVTAYYGYLMPIIAMTANVFKEDVDKAIEAGMDAHLAKPIDTRELTRTLERFSK